MKTTASILAIALCLAASAGAAQAQTLGNNQRNNANIRAQLNATIEHVGNDVALTSAAIANSFSATGGTGSSLATLNNYQNFWGDARSDLSASISNVHDDVSVTSAAIANSASIEADWVGTINNTQLAGYDPTSTLNATLVNVGDVAMTSAALSNSASIDADFGRLASFQANNAGVYANMNATVRDVRGSVTATAAAIGNSLSVTGF
jgi:hypothetical protein